MSGAAAAVLSLGHTLTLQDCLLAVQAGGLVAGCRRVALLLPGTGTSLAASDHASQRQWVKMYALSALEGGRHSTFRKLEEK